MGRRANRRRPRKAAMAAVVLIVIVSAALAWSVSSYLELVRLQVGLANAGSQVEAASHRRLALVRNLEQGLTTAAPAARDRAARLKDAVSRIPARPIDPAYRAAEERLSIALDEFWREGSFGSGEAFARADLEAKLAKAERDLDQALALLDGGLHRYDAALNRMPMSLVAGILGRKAERPMKGRRAPAR